MSGLINSCISDEGYLTTSSGRASAIVTQAVVDGAIETIVALWQRNASRSISNIQTNLADQQVALAEEVQAHAAAFWPAEKVLVDEVFGIAKLTPSYNRFMSVYGQVATDELDSARAEWLEVAGALGLAPGQTDDIRWQRNAAVTVADLKAYGARQEENRDQMFNDRRYAYQYAVLGMGRDAASQLVAFEGASALIASNAAGVLDSVVSHGLQFFGYEEDTHPNMYGWVAGKKPQGRVSVSPWQDASGGTMSGNWAGPRE